MHPTIILVHGAFAESASWNRVVQRLLDDGSQVIAAANPLRSLAADAGAITDLVRAIEGPVVLVGHSYGGAVISNVAVDAGDVTALVYVAAFAPDANETCIELSARLPGSTLDTALQAVPRSDGAVDLHIDPSRFRDQFCADVPESEAALMAVTQRPVTQSALEEPAGSQPLWRHVPSYFAMGTQDRTIPVALQHTMAERANAVRTVEVAGASHAVAVSRPDEIALVIHEAAALGAAA
jgi:pimeloyl-ACP methyl ester carboxylesterase